MAQNISRDKSYKEKSIASLNTKFLFAVLSTIQTSFHFILLYNTLKYSGLLQENSGINQDTFLRENLAKFAFM